MPSLRSLPALGLAALLAAAGCSSAAPHASTGLSASTSPTASAGPSHAGGLVGVIDAARLAAVCANAQEAETVQSTSGSAVSAPLLAAAGLLERPPVDPQAAAAAVAIRTALRRGRAEVALDAALAFCRAHGS